MTDVTRVRQVRALWNEQLDMIEALWLERKEGRLEYPEYAARKAAIEAEYRVRIAAGRTS
jgi:hypothetical protein